jgi:hypothetical protein
MIVASSSKTMWKSASLNSRLLFVRACLIRTRISLIIRPHSISHTCAVIFNNIELRAIAISNVQLMVALMGMVALDAALLAGWTWGGAFYVPEWTQAQCLRYAGGFWLVDCDRMGGVGGGCRRSGAH